MTLQDAIDEVKSIAKRCEYKGGLTEKALRECAEVYLSFCNGDGTPRPRLYMRTGERHERTALDEIQWLLVRTPGFRAWFGNSVVVDANGDPKVMFHGSWSDFKTFKPSAIKMDKTLMTLWSGPGFYFSDRPETAKIYAGGEEGRVYPVFLRIENPLVVDETGNAEDAPITAEQARELFLSGDNTQWLDAGLAAELARMDEAEGERRGGKHFYRQVTREERVAEFVKRLKTDVVKLKTAAQAFGARSQRKFLQAVCRVTGHDGVIHTLAPEVVEYVVYDPAAVKSAEENDGEYSSKSETATDAAAAGVAVGSDAPAPSVGAHSSVSETEAQADTLAQAQAQTQTKAQSNEGDNDMKGLSAVVDALKAMLGQGMDIVDAKGRHHQPKAIPEGGEYESEGKYAATAKAKEEWFHKTFAENNKPQMKKMRDICADILSRVDASKLGNDTAVTGFKAQVHKYADMPKKAILAGMKSSWDAMKRHADNYEEVKDMGKEEFAAWLAKHDEYNSAQVKNLMEGKAYGKKYLIKNEKGEYVEQDHEAWEEAKMVVGRLAVGSLVDYMAHTEALRNTPDELIETFLAGKGAAEKHKGGAEEYVKKYGVKHGEGETAKNVTMSEINAVESELAKAIEDAKEDKSKTAYFHALSHMLGKDGGLRDPEVTKEDVIKKAEKRLAAKKEAVEKAKAGEGEASVEDAQKDYEATQQALDLVKKVVGHEGASGGEGGGEGGEGAPSAPTTAAEVNHGEGEGKAELNENGVKLLNDVKAELGKDLSKKFIERIDKWLTPEDKSAHMKMMDGNGIAENYALQKELAEETNKLNAAGDKAGARKAISKYYLTLQRLHDQLEAVGK